MNQDILDPNLAQVTDPTPQDVFKIFGKSERDIDNQVSGQIPFTISAVASFNGSLTGTNKPRYGQGIRAITRIGTGTYFVYFNRPLFSNRYVVQVTISQAERTVYVADKEKQYFTVNTEDLTSTAIDTGEINIIVFGP